MVNKRWTLHVESLGKIKETDIRIAPLMLFVGDNNSGKSYLMSLLWGILTLGKGIFPVSESEAKSYRICEQWMKNNQNRDIELAKSDEEMFIRWFNDLLEAKKQALVQSIFNYTMEIGKIQISDYHRDKPMRIQWNESAGRYSIKKNTITLTTKETYTKDDYLKMLIYICWNLLMEGIAAPVFAPAAKGRRLGEPIYFPASRTGFMLTYPRLIETTVDHSFRNPTVKLLEEQATENYLSLPHTDFLQLILQFDSSMSSKKENDLVRFIEERLLKGKISTTKKIKMPIIQYTPNHTPNANKRNLPLYVSSSTVSEISPLALLLQSNINYNAIIIEEPEGHLHPEFQWLIARVLVKLVNSGKLVWITTHSDTILQHFNNMIKLEGNPNKAELSKEYEYDEDDRIAPRDIAMYQFDVGSDNRTTIQTLESNKYGFIIPTFNDTLEDILDEVYAFQMEED